MIGRCLKKPIVRRVKVFSVPCLVVSAALLSACIGNPGEFTIDSDPSGSWIDLEDADGERSFLLDGVDLTLPVEIDAAGKITYTPGDLEVEPILDYFDVGDEEWVMSVTIKGFGETQTGEVVDGSVVLDLPMVFELEAVEGYPGLEAGCQIGPVDGVMVADSYDLETGEALLVAEGNDIPAVDSCGDWNDGINWRLGLPTTGNAVLSTTILDPDGNPIELVEDDGEQ